MPLTRILATVATVLAVLVGTASPAAAHAADGAGATNFRTTLRSVSPRVPGIGVRVIEFGARLELTNTTATDAVVLGYEGEPFLRVGPDGVFENRRSPSTYLNRSREGDEPVPPDADPEAPPSWERVSGGRTARWHDHRAHWMGAQDPPAVRRAPGRTHVVIPEWVVQIRHGSQTVAVTGDLRWIPGPGPAPWLALALALAVLAVGAALSSSWGRLLAPLLAAVVLVDVVHVVGIVAAAEGTTGERLARLAGTSMFSALVWVAGVPGAVLLWRRRVDGLFAAVFAGVFVALFGGVVDLSDLSRSQVSFALGPAAARFAVAASLGLGSGIAAGAVLTLVRNRDAFAAEAGTSPTATEAGPA